MNNEFEISVFGPGFGECIVVHVGDGRWVIVDSCVDPSDKDDKRPVAEKYLSAIGVNIESQVDLIVASHWHDDHVRGLSRLVSRAEAAKFSCANALVGEEFFSYIETIGGASASTNGGKVTEIRSVFQSVIERDKTTRLATAGKTLKTWGKGEGGVGPACEIKSLSPSDKEFQVFLQNIAKQIPGYAEPKNAARRQDPNLVSVVLHIQLDNFSVLLGADMETHADPQRGWVAAICEARDLAANKSEVFKIAHHGSSNGHHDEQWTCLLENKPVAIVTPYSRLPAGKKLPTQADLDRISNLSGRLFVTSRHRDSAIRGRSRAVERSLTESNIRTRDLEVPPGMIRLRRSVEGGAGWRVEKFGQAYEYTG